MRDLDVACTIKPMHRARHYGMSDAQFIVALLSTLAWRTPFVEDLEPWPAWMPDEGAKP